MQVDGKRIVGHVYSAIRVFQVLAESSTVASIAIIIMISSG
jgi:hypothetical protein